MNNEEPWVEVEIIHGSYFHPNKCMVSYKITHEDPKGYEWKFLRNDDGTILLADGHAIDVVLINEE